MKKNALTIVLIAMMISLSACSGEAGANDNSEEIEKLEARIEELEEENEELKEELSSSGLSNISNSTPIGFVAEESGVCGVDLTWEYGNGILYINGTGDMVDVGYYSESMPWVDIKNKIVKIIISEGCTSVGSSAFKDLPLLSSVEIPGTVYEIGGDAFKDCDQLESVVLHEGIKIIDSSAFWGCTSLEHVDIPNNVTYPGGNPYEFSTEPFDTPGVSAEAAPQ